MATKEKTGRQVQASTRRKINARLIGGSAGATKTALRRTLQDSLHPVELTRAMQIAGLNFRTASADQMHELNYAISWARAWGKPLAEFYATPWGQDTGTAEFQLEMAA